MKKIFLNLISFVFLLSVFVPISQASAQSSFSDIESSPMKFYIEELAKAKVISGYADGTFRPKENVNRAQFAKMLALAMELPLDANYAAKFTDLGDWARPYAGALVKAGISKGKTVTIFGGNDLITRQEMAVMFVRAMGIEDYVYLLEYEQPFDDFHKVSNWAQPHVAFLKDIGFIQGNGQYYFPQAPTTREAFAKLTYRWKFEDEKYFERALNRMILEFYEGAASVKVIGENLIEIMFENGESDQLEISHVLEDIYLFYQYDSLSYLNGFDWNQMNSAEKKDLIMFVIQYWDSEYSEYQLLRPYQEAYSILLSRLNNQYVNSINNRDDILKSIVWAAVDTYTIEYIGGE